MNKFLALVPFFCFAACSAIRIDYTKQASAGETGGSGGASVGSGMGGSAGNAAFCTCESEAENDGERLKRQYLIGKDGAKMATGNWTDTATGDTCSFQKLPNGDMRCMPVHEVINTYSDPSCTKPIYVWFTESCEQPPKLVRYDDTLPLQSSNCHGEYIKSTFYAIGAEVPAPPNMGNFYFKTPGGSCTSPGPYNPFKYFELTEIGASDQFAIGFVAAK